MTAGVAGNRKSRARIAAVQEFGLTGGFEFHGFCIYHFAQPHPDFSAVRAGASLLLGGLAAIDEKRLTAPRTADHGAQARAIDDGDGFAHTESVTASCPGTPW